MVTYYALCLLPKRDLWLWLDMEKMTAICNQGEVGTGYISLQFVYLHCMSAVLVMLAWLCWIDTLYNMLPLRMVGHLTVQASQRFAHLYRMGTHILDSRL